MMKSPSIKHRMYSLGQRRLRLSLAFKSTALIVGFLLLSSSLQPVTIAQTPTNCTPPGAPNCTVNVPGMANPWLAGMPNGTDAGDGDFAPAQSPTLANCIAITPGQLLRFNVTGTASHGPATGCCANTGPEGSPTIVSHARGAQFGKSNVTAPLNSLVGVFLGPNTPTDPTPAPLDFSSAASRDFASLAPALQAVFFIGDGRNSTGCQTFIVPAGATRLFLGMMDGFEWKNNIGSYSVTFSSENPPAPNNCAPAGAPTCGKSVPGTSNPYLAGAPAGRTDSSGDVAPQQSPVSVDCFAIAPGDQYNFTATGSVSNGPAGCCPVNGPEGNGIVSAPPQFGISGITAPVNSLVGVFLGPSDPLGSPTPASLDFSSAASRDYLTLSPALRQVFFIGDGRTSGGACQTVTAPAGTTRLFLATMDAFGWANNTGAFAVTTVKTGTGPTPSPFDICLQDESTNNILQLNTTTGAYTFISCGNFIITGTASVVISGCTISAADPVPDHRMQAQIDTCLFRGTASAQPFAGTAFTITDRDTRNNTCVCQ